MPQTFTFRFDIFNANTFIGPLPLTAGGNINVDWGDSSGLNEAHEYIVPNIYDVTASTDALGGFTWLGSSNFWGQEYLIGINPTLPNTITNLSYAFYNASLFNQDISGWVTTNVTNMAYMFNNASEFNQPLNFDTSGVTSMEAMFAGASKFNQPINFIQNSIFSNTLIIKADQNYNGEYFPGLDYTNCRIHDLTRDEVKNREHYKVYNDGKLI